MAGLLAILAVALFGCTPSPVVTPPTPSPSPTAMQTPGAIASPGTLGKDRLPISHLPPREDAVFGPVEALRQTDNEVTLAYRIGDDPFIQRFGLAGTAFLTLGGHEYAIHWDTLESYKALKVGDTVNLHPSEYVVCIDRGGDFPKEYRMMRVYKGSRRIPPIQTR